MPTNSIGQTPEIAINQEQIDLTQDGLYVKMTDQEAANSIDEQINRAKLYWSQFKYAERQARDVKYYLGDQVDGSALRDDQEKGVENAIFRNIETMVPIATSRTPELTVTPAYKNDTIAQYCLDVTHTLQAEWEITQNMQKLMGQAIRNHQKLLLASFKKGYDPDTNQYWTKQVPVTELVFSKNGDFVAQYVKDETLGDLLDKFPDKQKEILKQFGVTIELPTEKMRSSPVEYIECWDNKSGLVMWKYKDMILDKQKNPHYDYTGQDVPMPSSQPEQPDGDMDAGQPPMAQPAPSQAPASPQAQMYGDAPMGGQQMPPAPPPPVMHKVFFNHFKEPKHPFIFVTYINNGTHLMDDTTVLEQSIGPQDAINKRKRQIGANADSTNGQWVSSGDYIEEEEFQKIDGSTNSKVWLEKGKPEEGFVKLVGQALPPMVFEDLTDSRSSLDNIMGMHDVTRGASSRNDTLGQDNLQVGQDNTRVGGYVRDAIEVAAKEWFDYDYQLHLVYQTNKSAIPVVQDDDYEDDTIFFGRDVVPLIQLENGDVVPVPISLQVKQGSTLPRNEVAEYQRAVQSKDVLAPIDFFKLVGIPNPKRMYKNFLMHQLDPYTYFFPNDKDIQAALAKKQQNAAKLAEPPKMSISVSADANTPEGAALLEQQQVLPPGSAQAAAHREVGTHAADMQQTQAERTHQTAMELVKQAGSARQATHQQLHEHRKQVMDHTNQQLTLASQQEAQSKQMQQQAMLTAAQSEQDQKAQAQQPQG